jgi:hypothetical protein
MSPPGAAWLRTTGSLPGIPLLRRLAAVLFCLLAVSFFAIDWAKSVAANGITATAKADAADVARSVLKVLQPDLLALLAEGGEVRAGQTQWPPHLQDKIDELQASGISVRVNLFDRSDRMVFSTVSGEVGKSEDDDDAIEEALRGQQVTRVVDPRGPHWTSVLPAKETVVENYLPITGSGGPVEGVFEMYSVSAAVNSNIARVARLVIVYGLIGSLTLYLVLLSAAYYSARTMDGKRQAAERNGERLRELSARAMRWEEDEKERVAVRLHEEVCQALTAVKYLLEAERKSAGPAVLPPLEAAIREIRAVAVELHPSSLGQFGLVAALDGLRAECEFLDPGFRITQHVTVAENEIPPELKPVMLRLAQLALRIAMRRPHASAVHWSIGRGSGLEMAVRIIERTPAEERGQGGGGAPPLDTSAAGTRALVQAICDRVTLSSGTCRLAEDGKSFDASWPAAR